MLIEISPLLVQYVLHGEVCTMSGHNVRMQVPCSTVAGSRKHAHSPGILTDTLTLLSNKHMPTNHCPIRPALFWPLS
jgi:hypothetical protein